MIGFVIVSHSRALAEAAVALAGQMAGPEPPPIRIAAGDAEGGFGTDATLIAAAIAALPESCEGVLVFMDLGSAVMSAELALDLGDADRDRIRLSAAPLVEGLVGAVARAGVGGSFEQVLAEAEQALQWKQRHLAAEARPGPE
jgi:dihydroxyacetone kinase phosphotransfer subunit